MRALMIIAGTLIFVAGVVAGGRLEPLVGAEGQCGGHPLAASITSSRRSCSWSIPIRRRRGNRSSPLSRRIAKTFEQQSVLWENARVCGAA